MSDIERKSPLVVDEEDAVMNKVESKIEQRTKKELEIPMDFIPVKFDSNGRLGYSKILHFRDYTIDDMLLLDTADEKDQLKGVVQALNSMLWEKEFDCMNLHIKDLLTVVYTLHGSFISNKIEKEYYKDDTLPEGDEEGQLSHKSNIVSQEIPLSCFKTKSIDQNDKGKALEVLFKEPFKVRDKVKNKDYYFIMPRVGHMITAYLHAEEKLYEKLREYSSIKRELKAISKIKSEEERDARYNLLEDERQEEYKGYKEVMKEYEHLFIKALKYQALSKIGDRELNTIEEKIDAGSTEVGTSLWAIYDDICKKYDFGIKEEITFKSDAHHGESITRRFLPQILDFLPTANKTDSRRFDISFD
jgi:hypothetical protein